MFDTLNLRKILPADASLDLEQIAEKCNDIMNEDFSSGPLEDKLRLIVALARRIEDGKSS